MGHMKSTSYRPYPEHRTQFAAQRIGDQSAPDRLKIDPPASVARRGRSTNPRRTPTASILSILGSPICFGQPGPHTVSNKRLVPATSGWTLADSKLARTSGSL